jgi:hypothetical protein
MGKAYQVLVLTAAVALAGSRTQPAAPAFDARPRGYVAYRAVSPIRIDGRLDDAAWQRASWTEDFVDIEGDLKPKPPLRTRVRMLWDDMYFYIGAELTEPHVWATQAVHDSVIFHENDFEFFIDPNGDNHEYYEFEINALGTYWDLLLPRPYKDGGKPVNNWEIRGLKSAVHVDGTIDDPRDLDRGWTVELAVPWSALGELARTDAPPHDGDQWRVNFSRVEWPLDTRAGIYHPVAGQPEHNWVWTPQHVVDMHRPESWGYVQFSTSAATDVRVAPDRAWPARVWLQRVYYAQRDFEQAHGRFAKTLGELEIPAPDAATLRSPRLAVAESLYDASIELSGATSAERWHIRQDSLVWKERGTK